MTLNILQSIRKMKATLVTIVLSILIVSVNLSAQDSLNQNILKPFVHSFQLEKGRLIGEGAEFLKREIKEAQYTLLGDYLDSKRISEFTAALIPELNIANYKTMALGIGPISAKVIEGFMKHPKNIVNDIKDVNKKYMFPEGTNIIMPIPDMKYNEDALFVTKAAEHDWSIIGFGFESWNGLALLLDEMYLNFPNESQLEFQKQYLECMQSVKAIYKNRNNDLQEFCNRIKLDSSVNRFITIASTIEKNKFILSEYKHAITQAKMHAERMFFEKNKIRIKHEKQLIKKGIDEVKFNIAKDKLFIKWDLNFLSKGLQPYAFYGVGNTMQELAAFYGNKSLNIGFVKRYFKEGNEIIDALNSAHPLKNLLQMGVKDKWVIIDLRPLIRGSEYHPIKFLINPWVQDFIKRYDIVIIPKLEESPQLNR